MESPNPSNGELKYNSTVVSSGMEQMTLHLFHADDFLSKLSLLRFYSAPLPQLKFVYCFL